MTVALRRRAVRTLPLVPAVILMGIFLLGPIVWSLYGSLTDAALTGRAAADPQWVGLENYARLLSDPVFPQSVGLSSSRRSSPTRSSARTAPSTSSSPCWGWKARIGCSASR